MADTIDNQTQDEWNEETVYGPSTVIAALDQIEDLVESSRAVPLSASIMVNKAEILDLLDQAREALPEDLVGRRPGTRRLCCRDAHRRGELACVLDPRSGQ